MLSQPAPIAEARQPHHGCCQSLPLFKLNVYVLSRCLSLKEFIFLVPASGSPSPQFSQLSTAILRSALLTPSFFLAFYIVSCLQTASQKKKKNLHMRVANPSLRNLNEQSSLPSPSSVHPYTCFLGTGSGWCFHSCPANFSGQIGVRYQSFPSLF